MKEEHGLDVFFGGCPVCKELCCCNNKSVFCHRKNHCYRKCPATKTNGKPTNIAVKEDSDSEPYHEELHNIPKPENGQYGIFDLLAAVADMDKSHALAKQSNKQSLAPGGIAGGIASSSSSAAGPRKKAKTGKERDVYPSSMLLCEPSYAQYFSSGGVPESVGNMQILNSGSSSSSSKGAMPGSASDSGVDGYTFNNSTMGIIRGGMGGVADAIALMGQQKQQQQQKAGKFNVGMDPVHFGMMSSADPLLASMASSSASAAPAASGAAGSSSLASYSQSSSSAAEGGAATGTAGSGAYNRLPSIDNNPFFVTATAGDAARDTPTFDQALLDSVRNIQQDPFNMPLSRPLPSVPRAATSPTAGAAAATQQAAGAAAPTSDAAAAVKNKPAAVSNAASLEPMNLLALVSSFTSSLDKSTHLLPAEHLLLAPAPALPAVDALATASATPGPAEGGV